MCTFFLLWSATLYLICVLGFFFCFAASDVLLSHMITFLNDKVTPLFFSTQSFCLIFLKQNLLVIVCIFVHINCVCVCVCVCVSACACAGVELCVYVCKDPTVLFEWIFHKFGYSPGLVIAHCSLSATGHVSNPLAQLKVKSTPSFCLFYDPY